MNDECMHKFCECSEILVTAGSITMEGRDVALLSKRMWFDENCTSTFVKVVGQINHNL